MTADPLLDDSSDLIALRAKGADVAYHDPFVPAVTTLGGARLESIDWARADLAHRDVAVITTAHTTYDWATIVRETPLVVDTRNATGRLPAAPNLVRL